MGSRAGERWARCRLVPARGCSEARVLFVDHDLTGDGALADGFLTNQSCSASATPAALERASWSYKPRAIKLRNNRVGPRSTWASEQLAGQKLRSRNSSHMPSNPGKSVPAVIPIIRNSRMTNGRSLTGRSTTVKY